VVSQDIIRRTDSLSVATRNRRWLRTTPLWHPSGVVRLLLAFLGTPRATLRPREDLLLENLALRQQLASLRRTAPPGRVCVPLTACSG
jgi:hypothetical protein